jgi:hypothetical protein
VPYHTRVSIDMKIFVGHWYSIRGRASQPPEIKLREDIVDRPVSFFYIGNLTRLSHVNKKNDFRCSVSKHVIPSVTLVSINS